MGVRTRLTARTMTPIKLASGRTFAGFSSKKNPPKSGGSVKEATGQIRPVSICAIYTRQGTNVNGASHTTLKTPFGGRASQNCAQRVFFSTASAIYLRFVGVSRGPALYSSVTLERQARRAARRRGHPVTIASVTGCSRQPFRIEGFRRVRAVMRRGR